MSARHPTNARHARASIAAFAMVLWTGGAAQTLQSDPPYVIRGKQTEDRQRAFHQRLDLFHQSLTNRLRQDAPDLLVAVKPPPPKHFGYSILPRLLSDTPPPKPAKPQVVSYSWRWSETLIAREMATIDRLDDSLAKTTAEPKSVIRATYQKLVADYETVVGHRRGISADIDYNWLWQARIADARPMFDHLTTRLNGIAEQQARGEPISPALLSPLVGFDPPNFVRLDASTPNQRIISVLVYTDIDDAGFVSGFTRAIENLWRVRTGERESRVKLTVTILPPEHLYCGHSDKNIESGADCTPPGRGDKIELAAHIARFPKDGAVITTGAASLQLIGNRAIVLGPHDIVPRVLAHEFGHVLGFPDAYLRGYKDLGTDGFQVMELVPDGSDIMSSPGFGSVLERHFDGLVHGKGIQAQMQSGLDALYQRGDPVAAIEKFRGVLEQNPNHYGATLQLAKALDRAGQTEAALPVWKKMLTMAEAVHDAQTLQTVRSRLTQTP